MDSADHEVDITQDMLEEEIIVVDFQKLDIPIMSVNEGAMLHIMAKVQMSGPFRFNYGTNGSQPENIEGQDQDFSIEHSSFNQNSTSTDFGQFPFILYSVWAESIYD